MLTGSRSKAGRTPDKKSPGPCGKSDTGLTSIGGVADIDTGRSPPSGRANTVAVMLTWLAPHRNATGDERVNQEREFPDSIVRKRLIAACPLELTKASDGYIHHFVDDIVVGSSGPIGRGYS